MSEAKNLQGIWTQYGQDRIAAWLAGGQKLTITHAVVGSGGGSIPTVSPSQAALVSEEWRGLVNSVQQNPDDSTDVMVDVVLPNNIGGFWIREWGLFDEAGKLVAVGPHDEMHKPLISSGQAAEFMERFHLPITHGGAITLVIATQALATQGFVQTEIGKHNEAEDSHGLQSYAKISQLYELCEFYYFRHPTLKTGFQPAQGGLLANAATLYPEAWAYLQTTEGKKLCKTEAEWQALTTAIWATLADGTTVGWNGIGGAPFYAPNTATGALRLPDLRGMYAEAAGYDSLGVGGVHGDAIRDITGNMSAFSPATAHYTGAFVHTSYTNSEIAAGLAWGRVVADFRPSRVVPVANKNAPRAWGALPCVYLGAPK